MSIETISDQSQKITFKDNIYIKSLKANIPIMRWMI